jgi:plasmid stabilization system protein ParE
MRYKVIVSDEAKRLMGNHVLFVQNINPEAAIALKDALLSAVHSLHEFPQRSPFLTEPYIPANKYRKQVVSGRYMLLYQIRDSTVYVDFIVDCRQDYKWLIVKA